MINEKLLPEILEFAWIREESGDSARGAFLQSDDPPITASDLDEAIRGGYLNEQGGRIALSEKGRSIARNLIRSHRLAERLMADVLDMDESQTNVNACTLEHALSSEVQNAICTLLGHPHVCPHGHPIPPGPCCQREEQETPVLVVPLSDMAPHQEGRILYTATRRHDRLDLLDSLGLIPGTVVHVHQTHPSLVVKVGETDVALDVDIGREVFVRRVPLGDETSFFGPPRGPRRMRRGWRRGRGGR